MIAQIESQLTVSKHSIISLLCNFECYDPFVMQEYLEAILWSIIIHLFLICHKETKASCQLVLLFTLKCTYKSSFICEIAGPFGDVYPVWPLE